MPSIRIGVDRATVIATLNEVIKALHVGNFASEIDIDTHISVLGNWHSYRGRTDHGYYFSGEIEVVRGGSDHVNAFPINGVGIGFNLFRDNDRGSGERHHFQCQIERDGIKLREV